MKSPILCAVFALGMLSLSPQSEAHSDRGYAKGEAASILKERMVAHLALSEGQQAQISAIRDATKQEAQNYKETVRQGRKALQELVNSDDFSEGAVRNLLANMSMAQQELMWLKASTQHQIRALLSEEQKQKWDKAKKRIKKRFKQARSS